MKFYQKRPLNLLASTRWYLVLLPFWLLLSPSAGLAAESSTVLSVDALGMTVSNVERAVQFYSEVLGFEKVSEVEVFGSEYEHLQGVFGLRMKVARMQLGDELIELTEYLTPQGKRIPQDSRSNDLWFQHIAIVVSDMDAAYKRLRTFNVQHVSTAPQTIPVSNKTAAGIRAFYFRDPDGHNLELIYFPLGKSDPKWQETKEKVFLGIDHSAIGISDTETSLTFYRDVLGLKVMGESLNHGTEQEHLANVFGARVHITGLRSKHGGPGIEFLEYIAPTDGRSYPKQSRPNDLLHWQTTLVVNDLHALVDQLRQRKYPFLSSGIVALPNRDLGFTKGLLVRGPDGHAMLLVER